MRVCKFRSRSRNEARASEEIIPDLTLDNTGTLHDLAALLRLALSRALPSADALRDQGSNQGIQTDPFTFRALD
jgi:hypothetical protein